MKVSNLLGFMVTGVVVWENLTERRPGNGNGNTFYLQAIRLLRLIRLAGTFF
ncbi:MAG TPA: hypothetical protein VGE06_04225 [Flavisolibacter sp.]